MLHDNISEELFFFYFVIRGHVYILTFLSPRPPNETLDIRACPGIWRAKVIAVRAAWYRDEWATSETRSRTPDRYRGRADQWAEGVGTGQYPKNEGIGQVRWLPGRAEVHACRKYRGRWQFYVDFSGLLLNHDWNSVAGDKHIIPK